MTPIGPIAADRPSEKAEPGFQTAFLRYFSLSAKQKGRKLLLSWGEPASIARLRKQKTNMVNYAECNHC